MTRVQRTVKRSLKTIFWLAILGIIGYIVFVYYFTWVNPVASEVRNSVTNRARARGIYVMAYNEIPAGYRNAVIATEDRSFFTNVGVDPVGIIRSLFVDVSQDKYAQGGSTITQQLIRNAYLDETQKTMQRKLTEAFFSIGLTRTMTKEDIFTLYTNDIFFGEGAYGLNNAAETYFGLAPKDLNEGELALLAGLPNAPTAYDPFKAPTLARQRQIDVVMNMVEDGMITQTTAKQILAEPIRLKQKAKS